MQKLYIANQIKADTTWFGNAWLSATGKSSGQLYFDYHFNNKGKNISTNDLIKLDFSELGHGITLVEVAVILFTSTARLKKLQQLL